MNMMVNTSELVGYEAEIKEQKNIALKKAVSKLVASWESKQAKKAMQFGGLGLMAISLAACNSSSDDTAATTPTTPATPAEPATPAAPVTNAITIAAATLNNFGTANKDVISATGTTLTSSHIIADATSGDGDTLTVTLTGDYALTPTVIGIEDVTFNIGETLASGNATLSVDVTNITASGDSIHFDVTNDNSLITNLIVTNAGTNTYKPSADFSGTVEIQSVADADVVVTVARDTSVSTTTGAGDDLTINGGTAYDITLTASTATEDLVVTGLDNTLTANSILGNATVTSAGDLSLTATAAKGNVTITSGDDTTTVNTPAAAGTVTINSAGSIAATTLTAATTIVLNNTGGTAATDDVVLTNGTAATSVTMTSVGAITATANNLAAAASITATAAEDSAITSDGVSNQVVNLNADSSGITNTPEITYTLAASTIETLNLGGVTAIEVSIDQADISTETVTSTNTAGSALLFTSAANDADTTAVAAGIDMRLGADMNGQTFTVDNDNKFVLLDSVAQTATPTFDHTTEATTTTTNSLTVATYNDDAATGDETASIAGLAFTDINNLTIAMGGTGTDKVGIDSSADITGADLVTVTVTGEGAFDLNGNTITGNATSTTSNVTLDASGVAGVVTMALDGTANGVESIQTGSGADAITIGAAAASGNAQSVTTNGGNDTLNIGAAVNFTFDGGPGVDTVSFAAGTNMSTKSMTLTSVEQIQLVGGGATQTINASFISGKSFILKDDATTSNLTINMDQAVVDVSSLGLDSSIVDGTDAITIDASGLGLVTTITGSGTSDTITGSAAADNITGNGGQDTITAGAGNDVITGGAGADTIKGEAGDDNITGGDGADIFILGAGEDTISDFVVGAANDDIKLDLSEVEAVSTMDLTMLDDHASVADSDAVAATTITGATDLNGATANSMLLIINGNITGTTSAALESALSTALETGGDFALKMKGTAAASDGFLCMYDNGTNSYLATVESTAGVAANAKPAANDLVVNNIAVFTGIADCTTILVAQYTDIVS